MPNWCSNKLTISGPQEDLETFKTLASPKHDVPFSMDAILPTPKNLENEGWHDWRINNWGTKWDANEVKEDAICEEDWIISFYTAWSPPCTFLCHAAKQFPTLSFHLEYEESGCDFSGRFHVEDGTVTDTPYIRSDKTYSTDQYIKTKAHEAEQIDKVAKEMAQEMMDKRKAKLHSNN